MEGTSEELVDFGDELLAMAQVSALKDNAGWKALVRHLDARIEQTVAKLTRELLHDGDFDQRTVDRIRGQYAALKAVKNAPQLAAAAYDRAKRKER